jgi:ADP-heptose:LPS heptosyltransferase
MKTQTSSTSNRWVRFRTVAYLRGKGFSFGMKDLWPQKAVAQGKYLLSFDPQPSPSTTICDEGFGVLGPNALDYGFLGPASLKRLPDILVEAASKIKIGGHLILLLPYTEIEKDQIFKLVAKCGAWLQKEALLREGFHLHVYKKLTGAKRIDHPRPTKKPRVCVARYGAIGDGVMLTPLLKQLDEDGYHVTLNCTEYALPVFKNNPHIHNIVLQEREAIPNPELGEYWAEWAKEYDRYINLSESIEGKLLKVEGRKEFFTSSEYRRETCGSVNYFDHTMALGGYSDKTGTRGELHFTEKERKWADQFKKNQNTDFLVAWALNGSSHHKIYALIQPVIDQLTSLLPNAKFLLLGDDRAKPMEFDHPQVIKGCGVFDLREVMGIVSVSDLVIGPESALINFAGCFDVPKIALLSHSSWQNLCANWTNDYSLAPDQELAPCYPCHQLHYTRESCPIITIADQETNEPLCDGPICAMGAISMERLIDRVVEVYNKHQKPL